MVKKRKLVPPDGGWGWMIVIAYAINNFVFIPILQSFGLIFKDTFSSGELSAADCSTIININAAFGMLMGLANGPLLKKYGYRKVSIAGSLFLVFGTMLTGFATNFMGFLISYGLITSIGMGMGMSSYPLALNTYFVKNRGKATGISFTITGLGPILMPQLITVLMYYYGVQGTMFILAAISAHTMIAALLLQPVKWHMKLEEIVENHSGEGDEKRSNENEVPLLTSDDVIIGKHPCDIEAEPSQLSTRTESKMSVNYDTDTQSIYGFELTMLNRTNSIVSRSECRSRTESVTARKEPSKLWMSAQSLKSIQNDNNYKELVPEKPHEENGEVKKDKSQNGFLQTIINLFDLSLLKDLTFVNIMCGISLATFAELNFTMLTPFILSDLGIVTSTAGIATFMSSLASADIVFRFLSPYIGSYLKKSPRGMYLLSMMMLVIFRYVLLFAPNYNFVMGVGVALGIAKGLRTVYVSMVIPAHVPIERLAAASGLQMMVNGCLFLLCGPVMGIIKDITGKYSKCVYALNTVTLVTVTMWTAELIYKAMRKKEKNVPVEMAE